MSQGSKPPASLRPLPVVTATTGRPTSAVGDSPGFVILTRRNTPAAGAETVGAPRTSVAGAAPGSLTEPAPSTATSQTSVTSTATAIPTSVLEAPATAGISWLQRAAGTTPQSSAVSTPAGSVPGAAPVDGNVSDSSNEDAFFYGAPGGFVADTDEGPPLSANEAFVAQALGTPTKPPTGTRVLADVPAVVPAKPPTPVKGSDGRSWAQVAKPKLVLRASARTFVPGSYTFSTTPAPAPPPRPQDSDPSVPLCSFFMQKRCSNGARCRFRHAELHDPTLVAAVAAVAKQRKEAAIEARREARRLALLPVETAEEECTAVEAEAAAAAAVSAAPGTSNAPAEASEAAHDVVPESWDDDGAERVIAATASSLASLAVTDGWDDGAATQPRSTSTAAPAPQSAPSAAVVAPIASLATGSAHERLAEEGFTGYYDEDGEWVEIEPVQVDPAAVAAQAYAIPGVSDADVELALQLHEKAESAACECGICMDNIIENKRRFGLMQNCEHAFCLECIRKWRASTDLPKDTARQCPLCRIESYVVLPCDRLIVDPVRKAALFSSFTRATSQIPCRYFDMGRGTCPFGSSCFYAHLNPDGSVAADPFVRTKVNADGVVGAVEDVQLSDYFA